MVGSRGTRLGRERCDCLNKLLSREIVFVGAEIKASSVLAFGVQEYLYFAISFRIDIFVFRLVVFCVIPELGLSVISQKTKMFPPQAGRKIETCFARQCDFPGPGPREIASF